MNDLNVSSHGLSTASNFYRSSTFQSEFSDFGDELKELTEFEIANYTLLPSREMIHRGLPKLPVTVLDD